jgi:hypothetical protein
VNLKRTIAQHTAKFARDVLAALRNASIEELVALTDAPAKHVNGSAAVKKRRGRRRKRAAVASRATSSTAYPNGALSPPAPFANTTDTTFVDRP